MSFNGDRSGRESKIDLVRPVLPSLSDLSPGLEDILRSRMVTKGQYLRKFEEAVAAHLGVRHAIGVSSCTTGLMLTYQALGLTGDVVVPSFTFMATVSSLVWAGLRPVFADVQMDTATVDPQSVEDAITPNTSAIVAVHNFGNPADIEELQYIADRHRLKLIFDAAHGFGSLYNGEPVGRQGSAQVFSLSPTKLLIAGEGGIVATQDDALAAKLVMGREYGNDGNYDSAFAGMNARLAEVNALMGLHSLDNLESASRRRNEVAQLYRERLQAMPGIEFQHVRPENRCSYKDFSIAIDADVFPLTRDQLATALLEQNIDSRKYYDPPVHLQTAYRRYGRGTKLPRTHLLAERSLSLPIWSDMHDETALLICDAVRAVERDTGKSNAWQGRGKAASQTRLRVDDNLDGSGARGFLEASYPQLHYERDEIDKSPEIQ